MTSRRILSRYIAGQTFYAILSTYAIFLVMILFIDIVELLRRGQVNESFGGYEALTLALFRLPVLSEKVLPFAVLFGSMFAFLKLNRRQELVIARSSGLSIWQFLTPPIVIAVLIGIFAVTALSPLGASLNKTSQRLEVEYFRSESSMLSRAKAGLWLKQRSNEGSSIIHAGKTELGGVLLKNITVWKFNTDEAFYERIEAPIAELYDGFWSLTQAWVTNGDSKPVKRNTVRLDTFLTAKQVSDSLSDPAEISFWQLPRFIETARKAGLPANRFQVQYHTLLSRPILLGAMVIVAAVFSMQVFRLGKIGRMVLGGVGSGFLLYFLSDLAVALGGAGRVQPIIAAWSPASIALMIGVTVLLYNEDG